MAASSTADAASLSGNESESNVAVGIIATESPRIGCVERAGVSFAKAVVPEAGFRILGNEIVARIANWNGGWSVGWHGSWVVGWVR